MAKAKAKKKHPWGKPGLVRNEHRRDDSPLSAAEQRVLDELVRRAGVKIEVAKPAGRPARSGWKNPLHGDKKRVSASDGERYYIRLKIANPAAQERVAKLIESGDYIYARTDDDVTVYRYADGSRFQRKHATITEMTNGQIFQEIMKSACDREWRLYAEACAELAYRFKSGLPEGQALLALQQTMAYLEMRIARRGGPGPVEIQHGLIRIRQENTGRAIVMPRIN